MGIARISARRLLRSWSLALALIFALCSFPQLAHASWFVPFDGALPHPLFSNFHWVMPPLQYDEDFSVYRSEASLSFEATRGLCYSIVATSNMGEASAVFATDKHYGGETLLASKTGVYRVEVTVDVHTDAPATPTVTLTTAEIAPVRWKPHTMQGPSSVHHGRWFDVGIHFETTPRDYDGFAVPLRYFFERKQHGKWVGYSSTAPKDVESLGDDDCAWASAKLPKGTFRVRARFQDAAHPTPAYNKWKSIVSR